MKQEVKGAKHYPHKQLSTTHKDYRIGGGTREDRQAAQTKDDPAANGMRPGLEKFSRKSK